MIISKIGLRNFPTDQKEQFPWTLPLIQNFKGLSFEKNICFFVGENGSGKSTILEAIAACTKVPLAGSYRMEEDESLKAAITLADYLSVRYVERIFYGFFVRAEDFIGFSRKMKNEIQLLNQEIEEVKSTFKGGDINLTIGTIEGEKNSLIKRYTQNLEALSHGEGFLRFFTSRITGKGIYLIDEPEAALSPARQLVLMTLIKDRVEKTGSHFIIATHSPILMSMPKSEVFYFNNESIEKVHYKDTEHYKLTKAILDYPETIF